MPGKLKPFSEVMELTSTISRAGDFYPDECEAYYDLLSALPDKARVLEIGLRFGRSSSIVGQVAATKQFRYLAIDPFIHPPEARQAWIKMMDGIYPQYELLYQYSHQSLRQIIERRPFDLALIDGGHRYDDTMLDCHAVFPHSSTVCIHDYGSPIHPTVKKAVDDYMDATGRLTFTGIDVANTLAIYCRTAW